MFFKLLVKNIFLSFDDEYLILVRAFRAQAKIDNNELEFKDYSIKESFNSQNRDYIKSQIKPHIQSCSNLIVLFGKDIHTSNWVDWEIYWALLNKKNVFGVILDSANFKYVSSYFKSNNLNLVTWNHQHIMNQIK